MQNLVIGSKANSEAINALGELFKKYDDYIFKTQGLRAELSFFEEEIKSLPGKYSPESGGEFFVIYCDDIPVACAGIIRYDHETCLLKRMFVLEEYQGKSLGRTLLETALATATKMGYKFMRFDSLRGLSKALKLYESYGFKEINKVHLNPYYPDGKLPSDAVLMEIGLK